LGEDAGSFTERRLSTIAEKTGLDMDLFNKCYSSNKYQAQSDLDGRDALKAGVSGTPSFVLSYTDANGEAKSKLIEGAQPFDTFKQEIETALTAVGK